MNGTEHLASDRAAFSYATLFVMGQAASLSLIEAGKGVHYQHYRPLDQLLAHPTALAFLALQLLIVSAGLFRRRAALRSALSRLLGPGRAFLVVGLLMLSSTTLSRDVGAYVQEVAFASAVLLVQLGTLLVFCWSLTASSRKRLGRFADRLLGPPGEPTTSVAPRIDRFVAIVAGSVTLLAAFLCATVYERHPHLLDEVVYLIQARYFAAGRLALPQLPVPASFELYLMQDGPQGWYAVVPPGWAIFLVPGVWLGAAWLVNPVLAGLCVVLTSLVVQQLYDRRTARLTVLLMAASPWHLFLGMSFMSHTATLCCALLATLGVMRARRTGQSRWTWLGGLALGIVAVIRQLDGAVMALLLGLWCLGLGGRRLRAGATVALVLGSMASAALILPYNRHFTGKASSFPIMAYNDARYGKNSNAYGFGPDRGMGWPLDPNPGHGPRDALINSNLNGTALSVELFGWSTGSLLFFYLFAVAGSWNRSDRLMFASIAAVYTAYFFNYFSGGPDFGARYWYLMLVPLLALTARGIGWVGARLEESGDPLAEPRVLGGAVLLVAAAALTFLPWRALDKYYHYLGMRADVRSLAADPRFRQGLVLVCGNELPDYASAVAYNPLSSAEPGPIFIRDAGPIPLETTRRAFPDRVLWILNGPTRTGGGYAIAAGPVAVNQETPGCHE
jgi:hypothetical protein